MVHDLDSYSVHSSAQMLDNVEAVKNNLRLWKELLSEPIIRAVHVHGDDLDQLPEPLSDSVGNGFESPHEFARLKLRGWIWTQNLGQ
ncbi:hypothetical protein D058_09422 [Streptococcus pneumoniae 2009]|nr:hypothetical protein D058_09422 [Streptococcus pneumoniae 2009]